MLREELLLAQEGAIKGPAISAIILTAPGKRKTQRALDAEKSRQAKDELLKKVDVCQRRTTALRDKYCRMLKVADVVKFIPK